MPWAGPSTLRLNGQRVRTLFGRGEVIDDRGQTVKVVVRRRLPDPLPTVTLDGHVVRFGLPWRWYEWLWMMLPTVLLLGGLSGIVAFWITLLINGRLMRSRFRAPLRYLATLFVVVLMFAGLLDLAWALRTTLPSR